MQQARARRRLFDATIDGPMNHSLRIRNRASVLVSRSSWRVISLAVCLWSVPLAVRAQSDSVDRRDWPVEERYTFEGFVGLWHPAADIVLSSDALGVAG